MKVSKFFVKTLREVPTSAQMKSHIFLLRGGYVKQLSAGLYSIMPLGKRVIAKIEALIRQEMNAVDGQEIDLPLVQPCELWEESGRYSSIGKELLSFQDRTHHSMVLAMTHEEAVTDLVRHSLNSYKQLPCMLYQFKIKFRDELRSRGGLIRVREFTMKDGYSFHGSEQCLDYYYQQLYEAYQNIFHRLNIQPIIVESDTGIMGGRASHEFMLECEAGEDYLIVSEDGKYQANQEIAEFDRQSQPQEFKLIEKVATPGCKTIEEVSNFLNIQPQHTMKAVVYKHEAQLILVLVRGDLQASEIKIKNYLGLSYLELAENEMLINKGITPGYAGPVGIIQNNEMTVLVDISIAEGNNFVGGANELNYHYLNVNFNRDFNSKQVGDFAVAEQGHISVQTKSLLKVKKGIEIGNIFKLGTKFSDSMKAHFLDEKGKSKSLIMGCYGIGVGRLMAATIENSHDDFGPIWPPSIAPFQVLLITLNNEALSESQKIYQQLQMQGYEVLWDDRNERPGVKFKDADLWGIPVRIGVSTKLLANQKCEWKLRSSKQFEVMEITKIESKLKAFFRLNY